MSTQRRMRWAAGGCVTLVLAGPASSGAQPGPPTIYLADFDHGQIHAMDRNTGTLIGTFPAPGSFPTGLEFAAGSLYVSDFTNCVDDRIYRMDPVTGAVLGSYPSPDCPIDGLAKDPSGAYLLALAILPTERLVVLEREQGTAVTTIALPNLQTGTARGVTWLGDLVYVSEEATGTIHSYSLDIQASVATPVGAITVGARCPGLTDDGRVLIAYDIEHHRLLEIDPVSGGVTIRPLPAAIGRVAGLAFAAGGCYPDCNADGSLTVADFGCFQTKFVAGDPYADCNADGQLTVADFGCFQTGFVTGCP